MKVGISSYSLYQAMQAGEMTILDVIDYVAETGAEHIEIVPVGFDLLNNIELVDEIKSRANDKGLEISNYAVGANFIQHSKEAYDEAINSVKQHVDIAARLGAKRMRHDVASRNLNETTYAFFEEDLPLLIQACREIADYAKQYNIITSVENHGFYIQASERVLRLVRAVDRDNFKTTLDVGNFLCVDEDPFVGVANNLPYASMVHFKDFYYRKADDLPIKEGWLQTTSGRYLRGAIVGQGDIPIREIVAYMQEKNYEGYVSIEFEGMEACQKGAKLGLDAIKHLWKERVK
ncbi:MULTISPECIES: sugar phosphate isomerase/epimerase family protein [Bacillaceae]|uniref:Sugar phosphate isomerase n=2 Tax=Bacillaceae TaxID=186817 RepID=A0A9D5I0C9_9BACI|nr:MULTISPECIES: sugar phosphate isomerase/epimerase family protein [Bacillaceae]KQL56386.1 sugar phosphate isomerase [Alkalicoccobacillus plakortidis]MBG9782704.1 sugar phosphate isomerase [Shouchella lehensis]TES47677.1 sugar phosphate isomerase/epimerase [Shouchella lehensis]